MYTKTKPDMHLARSSFIRAYENRLSKMQGLSGRAQAEYRSEHLQRMLQMSLRANLRRSTITADFNANPSPKNQARLNRVHANAFTYAITLENAAANANDALKTMLNI